MNNSLFFLNIKIVREGNKFTNLVYRNPTFRDAFTNFESFLLDLYKYTLNFALLDRASKLFPTFETFHQEIKEHF